MFSMQSFSRITQPTLFIHVDQIRQNLLPFITSPEPYSPGHPQHKKTLYIAGDHLIMYNKKQLRNSYPICLFKTDNCPESPLNK